MSTDLHPDPSWPVALAVPVLWITWLIYWAVSARDVKATRVRQPLRLELLHRVPIIFAALLLAAPRALPRVLTMRFLPAGGPLVLLGPILVAAGLGFAVWARRHLGRNWSVNVVVKEDHVLIRTGPYRHVRHPIYTGILLSSLGARPLWASGILGPLFLVSGLSTAAAFAHLVARDATRCA